MASDAFVRTFVPTGRSCESSPDFAELQVKSPPATMTGPAPVLMTRSSPAVAVSMALLVPELTHGSALRSTPTGGVPGGAGNGSMPEAPFQSMPALPAELCTA